MPAICPHYDHDPEPEPFFDPAAFFCEGGDYAQAAQYLDEGDAYRKTTLGLDADGVVELGRCLALRGLTLVDDGSHWLIAAAEPTGPVRP
jgi:hypothetical protein